MRRDKKQPAKKIIPALWLFFAVLWLTGAGYSQARVENSKQAGKKTVFKKEGGVSGIVFFRTRQLSRLKDFYIDKVGCSLWMDQQDCIILKFGNMLFGFCQRDKADLDALVTFFYENKEDVDRAYRTFRETAKSAPVMNKKYNIYHFFAGDPEGRNIEFQYFAGPIDWDFNRYK